MWQSFSRGNSGSAAEERLGDLLTGEIKSGGKSSVADKELNLLSAAFDEGPGLLEKLLANRFDLR